MSDGDATPAVVADERTSLSPVLTRLASAGPTLAVAAATLYATGFVIVTAYLGTFGVREVELVRSRYALAAVPFLTMAGVSAFVASELLRWVDARPHGRMRELITTGALLGGPALTAVVLWFSLAILGAFDERAPFTFWETLTTLWAFALFSWGAVTHLTRPRGQWRQWTRGQAFYAYLFLVFAIAIYVIGIYPLVPHWVGGGQPALVRLSLDKPIDFCANCEADDLLLLDEDSGRIVVAVREGSTIRAIQIRRSAVVAIRHGPQRAIGPSIGPVRVRITQ